MVTSEKKIFQVLKRIRTKQTTKPSMIIINMERIGHILESYSYPHGKVAGENKEQRNYVVYRDLSRLFKYITGKMREEYMICKDKTVRDEEYNYILLLNYILHRYLYDEEKGVFRSYDFESIDDISLMDFRLAITCFTNLVYPPFAQDYNGEEQSKQLSLNLVKGTLQKKLHDAFIYPGIQISLNLDKNRFYHIIEYDLEYLYQDY